VGTGARILVVDDNRSIVRMLELVLQNEGFSVVKAYDGYEALETARAKKPDIILLDVVMPGIDGYEVCRRLQALPETKDIPVIFLTTRGRVDLPETFELRSALERNVVERSKGYDVGAVGFISKPVSAKEVVAEVRRILAIRHLGG
jgi:CheY-like chemotaxis protein